MSFRDYFDGSEDEYCLRCHKRNKTNNPICECGSTSFIYGKGLKPIRLNKEGYSCSCGRDLEQSKKVGHICASSGIYETYSKCDCGNLWGVQIKVKE